MTIITITKENATVKEIRRTMRSLESFHTTLIIEGWGQIRKTGKTYSHGPLPEQDDSDPMTDYTAWTYGWKESWLIDDMKRSLHIA